MDKTLDVVLLESHFKKIANRVIRDFQDNLDFICFFSLRNSLDIPFREINRRYKEKLKDSGLEIENWYMLLTSELIGKNQLIDELVDEFNFHIKDKISMMMDDYIADLKQEMEDW